MLPICAALLAFGLVDHAAAAIVYATAYGGSLYMFNVTAEAGHFSADLLSTSTDCGANPTWATLDALNGLLYCVDEAIELPRGSVSVFNVSADGQLGGKVATLTTHAGPVAATLYGPQNSAIAVAQYASSAVSSYWRDNHSTIRDDVWNMLHPGPVADRQSRPHPHGIVSDPTGSYLFAPDLGADMVRVFVIYPDLTWLPLPPVRLPGGSGPRHATFSVTPNGTFMYVASELANTITGYRMTYQNKNHTLHFDKIFTSGAYGIGQRDLPENATIAEILASPDQRYVLASIRNDKAMRATQDGRTVKSDTIVSFSVDPGSGMLTQNAKHAAGGMIPRQFSMNKDGSLLAVALQGSSQVAFISRNPINGKLTGLAGTVDVEGGATSAIFYE